MQPPPLPPPTGSSASITQRLRERTRSATVRVDGLGKTYGGRDAPFAVRKVSFEIAAGETFALVGPYGAGKSTTLRLICGLLAPTTGGVVINHLHVERDADEAQAGIGYLAAPFGVYDDLLVWEYLDYFARAHGLSLDIASERVEALLDMFGLTAMRGMSASGLPPGTKVLLGLARALVHDPPFLVLDEPTTGLDARDRARLKRVLADQHAQGKTILLASPTITDVEVDCNTVRLIARGELLPPARAEQVLQEAMSTGEIP